MKRYETSVGQVLPWRIPVILRVDGRAFHTLTRGYEKPFDGRITNAMHAVASELLQEVAGAVMAYVQSDEISVLMLSDKSLNTQPWFGNTVAKIISVGAGIATSAFNEDLVQLEGKRRLGQFDARAFSVPPEDVNNYFLWRQQDAVRNSIQGVGQAHFSHRQLQNVSCKEIQEMLWSEHNINWNDYPDDEKRGWVLLKGGRVDTPDFGKEPDFVHCLLNHLDMEAWRSGERSVEDLMKMARFMSLEDFMEAAAKISQPSVG